MIPNDTNNTNNINYTKTYKITLNRIINNGVKNKITNACITANEMLIHVYQFIRLFILYKYHNNQNIPNIDVNFVKLVFKTISVSENKNGPKCKNENLIILNELNMFYDEHYAKDNNILKINSKNLSSIIDYLSTTIVTSINNNILLNFEKYVNRFVNSSFKHLIDDVDNIAINKSKQKKEIYKELTQLKNDLKTNNCSNIKYKDWFDTNRPKIYDESFTDYKDITIPQLYFKNMIYMNNIIQTKGTKQFQFFPLKNSFTLNYITFDTKALVEILDINPEKKELTDDRKKLMKERSNLKLDKKDIKNLDIELVDINEKIKNINTEITNIDTKLSDLKLMPQKITSKKTYLDNIEKYKLEIWSKFFNLKHKIFKTKGKNVKYNFDYIIQTDSYGVSLIFVENNKQIKANKQKKDKLQARNEANIKTKEINNTKTPEEIKVIRENNITVKTEKINQLKLKRNKIKKEFAVKIKKKEVIPLTEFKYITELTPDEMKKINDNYVVIDPGKRTLLQILGKNGKNITYTKGKHNFDMKTTEFETKLLKYKKRTNIQKIETKLSNFSHKTVDVLKFKEYISEKQKIITEMTKLYNESKCLKYKWYRHLNEKRSINNLVNTIKETYGKNVTIFIGDWSEGTTQLKNSSSTPRIGLKRQLKKYFKVYNLDEYNTSKKNCYTGEDNRNMYTKETNNENLIKLNECVASTKKIFKQIKIKTSLTSNEFHKIHNKTFHKIVKKKLKRKWKLSYKKDIIINKKKYKDNIKDNIKDKIKDNIKDSIKNDIKNDIDYKIKDNKYNKNKKLHSVLTYQMEKKDTESNRKIGCINRDKNSCKNMIKIVEEWKTTGTRPKYLERTKQ